MELQWGHRLSAMESAQPHTGGPLPVDASMGPPPFGDGKHRRGRLPPRQKCRASMGPPPFGDGNPDNLSDGFLWNGASMGPPPFGDGKRLVMAEMSASGVPLQWGHRLSAMETASIRLTIDCDIPLQWGHRLSAMESSPSRISPVWSTLLQWGHRLSAMESSGSASGVGMRQPCFNGATAFRRWKDGQGHSIALLKFASMGPPPFGDGKTNPSAPLTRRFSRLQWGHRLSAMESPESGENWALHTLLQWGHRLSAMERTAIDTISSDLGVASMGPPPFGDGKYVNDPCVPLVKPASMGPPPFGDGKQQAPRSTPSNN